MRCNGRQPINPCSDIPPNIKANRDALREKEKSPHQIGKGTEMVRAIYYASTCLSQKALLNSLTAASMIETNSLSDIVMP